MSDFNQGLTVNSVLGIGGTILADNAQAGALGEFVQGQLLAASPISLTSGTTANIVSISLTAGDWDISGIVDFLPAATTSITQFTAGISTTSATFGLQDTYCQISQAALVQGANMSSFDTPTIRISTASAITVYLVSRSVFTASTLTSYGTIRARRVR